jgi:sugar phosphate isomerase/epimerase
MFKYSVVCDTLRFLGWDIAEDPRGLLTAIKNAGYVGCDLPCDPDRISASEFLPIIESLGLHIPAVQGVWGYSHAGESRDLAGPDEEARRRGIEHAKEAVDLAVELGADCFQVCAPQPGVPQFLFPDHPIRALRSRFLESLKEICEYAGERDITILLEPVNAHEAYPGVLTSVPEAISLIQELGLGNMGIQPDIYHMNIADGPISDALRAAGNLIRHVHVNETNRYGLGTGHADYTAILRTLKEIDCTAYLAVYMPLVSQEVFHMSRLGYGGFRSAAAQRDKTDRPDPAPYLEKTIRYLKDIEEAIAS